MVKNKIIYYILFYLAYQFSYGQQDHFGSLYQNCIFKFLSKKQVRDIKNQTKKFEYHLVEKGILKNSTNQSYIELFNLLDKNEVTYQKDYDYGFIDSIQKITEPYPLIHNLDCFNELKQNSGFKKSKFYIENLEDDKNNSLVDKLNEDDCKLPLIRTA